MVLAKVLLVLTSEKTAPTPNGVLLALIIPVLVFALPLGQQV
jgi:hypothetical protein